MSCLGLMTIQAYIPMSKIEKTVFISYRRTNVDTALLIYQNLTQKGYDVFFDFESIKTGDFGKFIYQNIESRAHFVVILKPKTLDRCVNPDDWVRREIEHAVTHRRNIIPIAFDGFDLKDIDHYLPTLSGYNALSIPVSLGYLEDGVRKLIDCLNVSLDVVLHPVTPDVQAEAVRQQEIIEQQPSISINELTAQEYFERGKKHEEMENWEEAIADYTDALEINPDYIEVHYHRGLVTHRLHNYYEAIDDYNKVIRSNPHHMSCYLKRAEVWRDINNFDKAIQDYNKHIRVNHKDTETYYNRADLRREMRDFSGAIADYTEYLNHNPDDNFAYYNRADLKRETGDFAGAIEDYTEIINRYRDHIAYYNRADLKCEMGDFVGTIEDCTESIIIEPNNRQSYKLRSEAKRHVGDINGANHDLKMMLKFDEDTPYLNHILYILKQGRYTFFSQTMILLRKVFGN